MLRSAKLVEFWKYADCSTDEADKLNQEIDSRDQLMQMETYDRRFSMRNLVIVDEP